ncbi:hypothetical protein [Rhizorhapis sp. SPR117]|uniref:hypothetical protein n=1 Tax=Rhizorhapis sp. SPR117 TaxID=2912611 RepID=UPI001F233224|nr:hypothetical protein [Rhizorhapis sp. SPR117]
MRCAAGGGGRAFSIAWDAALRLARQRLVDTAWTRALEGQEEDIVSGGQVTGTRTRIDNRLLIFLINRADRGFGTGGELLVNIANEYDSFLDAMEQDAETIPEPLPPEEEEAEEYEDYEEEEEEDETEYSTSAAADFLRARQIAPYEMRLLDRLYEHKTPPSVLAPDPAPDPAPHPAPIPPGEGTAPDIDISDLDPADMHHWTLDQWERAYHSGLTEKLLAEWEVKEDETCPPQP